MAMILGIAALLPPHRMGVVETNQPFTVPSMERQRIVQTVRLLRSNRNARHHKANSATAFGVNNEREAIKIEQGIEGRILLLHREY